MIKLRSIFGWLKSHTAKMKSMREWKAEKTKRDNKHIVEAYFQAFLDESQRSKDRKLKEKGIQKSVISKFFTLWANELNSRRRFSL